MPLPNINTVSYSGNVELIKTLYFKYYQTPPDDYNISQSTDGKNPVFDRNQIERDYTNFINNFKVNPDNSVTMPNPYICPYPYSAYYPTEIDNNGTAVKQYLNGTNYSLITMKQLADDLKNALIGQSKYSDYSTILKNAFNEAKNYIPNNSNLNSVDLTDLSISDIKPHIKNMLLLFNNIKNHTNFKSKNPTNGPYENPGDSTKKNVTVPAVFDAVVDAFTRVMNAFGNDDTIQNKDDYINMQTRELYQMSGTNVDAFKTQYSQTMILGAIMTVIMSSLLYFIFSTMYSEGLGSSGNGSNAMPSTNTSST